VTGLARGPFDGLFPGRAIKASDALVPGPIEGQNGVCGHRLQTRSDFQGSVPEDFRVGDDAKKVVYAAGILWLDGEDPEMAAAIKEAQRTFRRYRERLRRDARRVVPAVQDAGVKVFFPSPSDPRAGEHMWVNEVVFDGRVMRGTLRNDPGWLRGLSEGDGVSFTVDRVSDWFFVVNGVVQGGFTIKILLRHYTPEQFAECREDPPACYFADWYDEQQSRPDA
jgi:uncharacterized protein YegJ (DUF2314 family)